jgi:hypothetical protein
LDSDWVYEELLQAEKQGFGILQVLWPNRRRDSATQFCDLFQLTQSGFVNWSPPLGVDGADPRDVLDDTTVENIMHEVERTRIRSIRNRRDQVLTEIVDTASDQALAANVSPTGNTHIPCSFIEFRNGEELVGLAFPVVGFPDSVLLHDRHDLLQLKQLDLASACVVYDELGMTAKLKGHLEWLNNSLAIRTVPVTALGGWLGGLA